MLTTVSSPGSRRAWDHGPAMATRMTSTRFVGRSGELAELEAALRDAAERRPSLALIAGESGVGKSRLVQELIRRVGEDGAFVLSGDCVDLGEGELPYAPLVAALRPLLRDEHPALQALPTPLWSALGVVLPGLQERAAQADAAQASVFEAVLTLLEALGDERPVLLAIEDVHWADSSTRAFLSFLSRTICRERLMLVATYRSDELHRRHPLRPLLGELARDPSARLIELPPFTREELADQLEGILAGTPDPALVERVWARSEGNALFAEEILAAGLDGRGPLPPTLRDALMLRVESLSEPAQEVLRWVACQTEIDHELLATVTDLDAVLAQALEERIAAGDRGAHITAQAAHHWMAAGEQTAALRAAVRAADAAEQVDAYPEAHALLERALGLWGRVYDPEKLVGAGRGELLLRAADAAAASGEAARFEAPLEGALELVDPAREPRRAASILARLHSAQWDMNRQDESIETIDRALALLEPFEPTFELAALLSAKARARMLQSRNREAIEAGREAIEVARSVGDAAAEVQALNAIGVALAAAREVDEGISALREALALARERGLDEQIRRSSINLADTLHHAGRSEEALSVAREGLEEAMARGWRHTWVELQVAEIEFDLGDWRAAAQAMPDERRRRYWGTTLLNYRVRRAEQALGRGDDGEARADLEAAARVAVDSTEPQFLAPLGAHRAELERRGGGGGGGPPAVGRGRRRNEFCSEDLARIAQVAAAGVRVEADATERARDYRDDSAERAARERATAVTDRVRIAAEDGGPVVGAQRALAEGELARAEHRPDPSLWEAAATAWDDLGHPYPAAYARWREAEALVAARDREAAERVAGRALQTARRLGSKWLAAEIEGLATRARLRIDGAERAADTDGAGGEEPFGLTAREQEVLALVAAGATNREIGERLHMAEKTASVHVSRILAKLGVRTRTEAAAVAHRHGLAETAVG